MDTFVERPDNPEALEARSRQLDILLDREEERYKLLKDEYDKVREIGRQKHFDLYEKRDTRRLRVLVSVALFVVGLNVGQWLAGLW
jgi:hypothetical protein